MGVSASRPTDRSRTLEVINAGFGRTGTVSMASALQRLLDGPVMHGGTSMFAREDAYVSLWVRIFAASEANDRPTLLKLLREATIGFAAVCDAPCTMFVEELVEIYPDAKVVLVDRDPERWWASFEPVQRETERLRPAVLNFLTLPFPTWRWTATWIRGMSVRETKRLGFTRIDGPEHLRIHNNQIKSVVPPEKLLVMRVNQGWEPLARFLGKPVPNEPFPHENDAETFDALARNFFIILVTTWTGIITIGGWGGWVIWQRLRI